MPSDISQAHSSIVNALAFLEPLLPLKETASKWKELEEEGSRLEKSISQKQRLESELIHKTQSLEAARKEQAEKLLQERAEIIKESREKLNAQENDLTSKIETLQNKYTDLKASFDDLDNQHKARMVEKEKEFQRLRSTHASEISSLVAKREELERIFQEIQQGVAARGRKLA